MAGEPSSRALASLEGTLVGEFRDAGVARVEYVLGGIAPCKFWLWLGTATDAERDALSHDPTVGQRVHVLAEKCGLATQLEGVDVQTQETVDREYRGRWFYRLR